MPRVHPGPTQGSGGEGGREGTGSDLLDPPPPKPTSPPETPIVIALHDVETSAGLRSVVVGPAKAGGAPKAGAKAEHSRSEINLNLADVRQALSV